MPQRILDHAEPVVGVGQFAVQFEYVEVRRRGRVSLARGDCGLQDFDVCRGGATAGPADLLVESI